MRKDPYFHLTMFFIALGFVLMIAIFWRGQTRGFNDIKVVGLRSEVGMWGGGR